MDNGYEYVTSRRGYNIYRKIVDGKGKWKAEKNGTVMDISYDQARGFAPLDNSEALGMELGRMLLPQ